jgi:hypothetical protein
MRAVDRLGNPVPGQTLGFKVTASGSGPVFTPLADGRKEVSGTSGADGLVTVYLVSEYEGSFPVVGVVQSQVSAAKNVTFAKNTAVVSQSWFTVQAGASNMGNPAWANGKDFYRVTVHLRDSDGNPVNNVTAAVRVAGPDATKVTDVTTAKIGAQSGTAQFDLTATKVGKYEITVELGGDQLGLDSAGANTKLAQVSFYAGPVDGSKSYLVGPKTGAAQADGKDQQRVEAHLLDAFNNPVPAAGVAFAIPANVTAVDPDSGGAAQDGPGQVNATSDSSGVAILALTSKVKNTYQVTAKAGSVAITTGSPAQVVFKNAAVSAARSVFTLPTSGTSKMVRSEYHAPQVEVFDVSGNRYTDAVVPVSFRWRLAEIGSWQGPKTVDTVDGIASWMWTVNKAGTYEVEAALTSGTVGSVLKATFKAGSALPEASQFTSSAGIKVVNDGKAAHYAQVLVLDDLVDGNPVADEPVTFTVTGSAQIKGASGSGQTWTLNSSALGVSRIEIVDQKVGGETVTVTAQVKGVKVGSAQLEFGPDAPSASHSIWSVKETTPISATHPAVLADGADSWTATVTVRDQNSQAVVGSEVIFDLPAGVAASRPGPYRTDAAGQIELAFTSTRAGNYEVRALIGAEAISPGARQLKFAASGVDPDLSYLEGPTSTAVANGKDELVVRAVVLDGKSNPVPDATVRFALPQGLTVVGQKEGLEYFDVSVGATNGVAQIQLVSTKAASYKVTAQAAKAGGSLQAIKKNSPAVVQFVAGPAVAAHSVISRSPAGPLVVGGTPGAYQVKAALLDEHSNPVQQADMAVLFHFFPEGDAADPVAFCRQTPGPGAQSVVVLTNAQGEALTQFSSTKAGPWRGCATYNGDQIAQGSPVDLAFVTAPAEAASSLLEVSENLVPADGKAAHYGKVTVKDNWGNPVGGQEVVIGIEAGATQVPGPNVKGSTELQATVKTCDPANAGNAPAYCTVNGVFQTGVAMVEFTSQEPGTFNVHATLGGKPVGNSPGQVSFTSGNADPAYSSWAILPNTADPKTGDQVSLPASGQAKDSYQVTVTVRSNLGLLVPGARVRVAGLPADVKLVGSTEGVSAAANSGAMGTFQWQLYSAVKNTYKGQVQLRQGDEWVNVDGPFTLRFAAGDSPQSWFTLTPTDANAGRVVADGASSYTLTVHVRNPDGTQPVVGACVTPQLSAGLTVISPPSSAECGAGQYVTGADGSVALKVVSQVAGRTQVGVKLGDSSVPTEVGGSTYTREAWFTGGAPSGAKSELTSPPAPVRADDPAGQVVKITLRDAFGNPASCWAANGTQVPCSAQLVVPAGTHVGTGAAAVTGPGTVMVEARLVDYSGTKPVGGGGEVRYLGQQGTYTVTAKVGGADVMVADGVTSASGPATVRLNFTDATKPLPPVVDPTTGDRVTGSVADGDKADAERGDLSVVVTDKNGEVLGNCPVGADGRFNCPLVPKPGDGAELEVKIKDKAGNQSDPVKVVVNSKKPPLPQPAPTDGNQITGSGGRPGDLIEIKKPDGTSLGTGKVGPDGRWSVDLKPPAKEGDKVLVIATGPNGLTSERPWRVGIPKVEVVPPQAYPGDPVNITGKNFQPGEKVTVRDGATVVGSGVADAEGRVVIRWKVPAAAAPGKRDISLVGEVSGTFQGSFQVLSRSAPPSVRPTPPSGSGGGNSGGPKGPGVLPFTGADGVVTLLGCALGLALAGGLLLVARRRR